jgi:hypothetical protein
VAKKGEDYPRDASGIPCTCSENRVEGDPQYHANDCPWALAQLEEEEDDLDLSDIEDDDGFGDEEVNNLWG